MTWAREAGLTSKCRTGWYQVSSRESLHSAAKSGYGNRCFMEAKGRRPSKYCVFNSDVEARTRECHTPCFSPNRRMSLHNLCRRRRR